jgi:hypothetical protein
MRRVLFLIVLLIATAPQAVATNTSPFNRPLPGNQLRQDQYRGYYRTLDSSLSGKPALHSAPSEASPKLMDLTASGIAASEGIVSRGPDTTWLKVVIDGQAGWVQIRYLRHIQPETFPGTNLAVSGSCNGYDPLWAFSWERSGARLSTFPGTESLSIGEGHVMSARNVVNLSATNQDTTVEAVFDGNVCAPVAEQGLIGMLGIFIVTGSAERRLLSGCCQPSPQAFTQ